LGCGPGWRRRDHLLEAPVPARQQVQVWQRDTAARWHGLVVTADSVSGIPFLQPLRCDTCRILLERPAVDSIRFGNPVGGFWRGVGLVFGTLAVVLALIGPRGGS
jgi:hypothetical protein